MYKNLIFTILSALLFLTPSAALAFKGLGSTDSTTKDVDITGHQGNSSAIVATINGAEITLGSLMNAMMELFVQGGYGQNQLSPELAARIRYQALDELATEELAYQRGVSLGLSASPEAIEKNILTTINAYGSEENLQKILAKKKKTIDDLRNDIKRAIVIKHAIIKEVSSKVIVTPEEIEELYVVSKDQFVTAERLVITDIIFFLDPDDPNSYKKINQIKNKVINELGNDPTRLTPDGFIVKNGTNIYQAQSPVLYQETKKIEVGSLSDPILLDGTLHLIKFDYQQPRSEKPKAEALKLISQKLKSDRRKKILNEWRTGLTAEADIKIVHDIMKNPDTTTAK
jgi:hypothetical protein